MSHVFHCGSRLFWYASGKRERSRLCVLVSLMARGHGLLSTVGMKVQLSLFFCSPVTIDILPVFHLRSFTPFLSFNLQSLIDWRAYFQLSCKLIPHKEKTEKQLSKCLAVVNHQILCHKASTLGHTGCFSTVLNKSTDMSPWLCFLPQLSVPRGHRRPLGSWTFLFSAARVGRERDCQFWAELKLNNGQTVLLYQHLFLSVCPQHPPPSLHFSVVLITSTTGQSAAGRVLLCTRSAQSPVGSLMSGNLYTITLISVVQGKSSGVDQVSNPRHYSEQCILSLYFDLAICTAGRCLWRNLFSRQRMTVLYYSVWKTEFFPRNSTDLWFLIVWDSMQNRFPNFAHTDEALTWKYYWA